MLYLAPVWYSVQFTKQLLENGNDVEVAAVSDQTVQILSSLMKMTWNMSVLRPSLLRPKFESIKEAISAFGKVVSTMEPSDIIFTNMAMNIIVYEESSCEVHLLEGISERDYEAALEAAQFLTQILQLLSPLRLKRKNLICGQFLSHLTKKENTTSKCR